MQQTPFNIREGMNVCDRNGDKIGTVKMVHEVTRAAGLGGTLAGPQGYVHCDTGFLGLGQDLYIPMDQFSNCTSDRCYLNVNKDNIKNMGWNQRPTNI